MKHTGNQKVVTALLSESLYKGSYLPHIQLVLAYLIEIPSMLLQSKIGACGVLLLGLPISNRDITARGYPVISGWGLIRSPSGSNLLPDRWAQDCAGYPAAMPGIFYLSSKNRDFSGSYCYFLRGNAYLLPGNAYSLPAYFFQH